ncbi:MAG: ABC transporter substrate-binding protein [Nitrososphaerales archaeon]
MHRKRIASISRIALVSIMVIIIVIAGVAGSYVLRSTSGSSSSLTTGQSSTTRISSVLSTTNQSANVPPALTWETPNTVDYLDPHVSYTSFGYQILQNIYEPLLWYNASCSTCIIPWLAKNYTTSTDLKTYNFTLRQGITFADGEPLNSSAVYFSLNRLLIEDGSTPVSHGTQASFILQQLENISLSTTLCGCAQTYNTSYADLVLAQNFVAITGSLTFTIHVQNPNLAFQYMLGDIGSDIIAPLYIMQNDLSLWNQNATGYSLPYPSLSGNESQMMRQYFVDEVSTCDSGATPHGCGTTFLDGSYGGSLAGTGPYVIKSFDSTTNDFVLEANPHYWGGPIAGASKIVPQIHTIYINYVPEQTTRILDLRSAASAGGAMTVDVEPDHLYDVADRNSWLFNHTLISTLPGVSIYGPFKSYYTYFDAFSMNVSNEVTGAYNQFQPFADQRMRLAFADAVNMTDINEGVNNELGQVAYNLIPPGLPPAVSSNSSIGPIYKYNLTAVQNLLLGAMIHPLTHFTFFNGTMAPQGVFNNTFGCPVLDSSGQCSNPVRQSTTLTYYTGDTVDETIFSQIASAINNVSNTYNMGLSVSVTPEPFGYMSTLGFSDKLYMYMIGGWGDDYPWVTDFLGPMYAPGQIYSISDGWNITQMGTLYSEAVNASARGDIPSLARATNAMNALANSQVMYLWTFYPLAYSVMTSNIHGFFFNPSLAQQPTGFYFAALY